jgi:hypothetical protein
MPVVLLLNISFAIAVCAMLATVMWLAFRLADDDRGQHRASTPEDEDTDRGSGGGGSSRPPGPDGGGGHPGAPPDWWPDFECQFAAYVERVDERTAVSAEPTTG